MGKNVLGTRKVYRKPSSPTERDLDLLSEFRRHGAPLLCPQREPLGMDVTDTLAEALPLVRKFALVADVWPVVFHNRFDDVDMDRLEERAREMGQGRTLGFLLSVTRLLTGRTRPFKAELRLETLKAGVAETFSHYKEDKYTWMAKDEWSPPVAREWGFRMTGPLDAFWEAFENFSDPVR